jgi:hypothetical protein
MTTASGLALALALGACSPPAGRGAPSTSGLSEPPPLSARLYQSRMDVDDRQLQVRLHNAGDADVVVERMTLTSTGFDDPMVYRKRGSVLQGGRTVDMPVVLSDPVCGGSAPSHTARVAYRLEDGSTGSVDIEAVDEHETVAQLHSAECFAIEASQAATLSIRGGPRLVTRGGALAAELVVDVAATGEAPGPLQLRHVGNTTLLQHAHASTLEPLTEGLRVDLQAPEAGRRSFTMTLVPSRCDAHALAEDKQGTRFRVLVELDGKKGQVSLPAGDPVKVALHDFVRRACGSRDDSTP